MKDWFDSLDTRERWFVSVGAVVVAVTLAYALGWAPLDKKHTELKADVAKWERALTDLRPLRASAASGGQSRSSPGISTQQSPIIIVDQTLRSRGLDRYRKRS